MLQLRFLVAAVALLTAALLPSVAQAAFPGANGKIVFTSPSPSAATATANPRST